MNTGSSRSARNCRSPRRRTTSTRGARAIQHVSHRVCAAIASSRPISSVFGTRIFRFTGYARCGGSCIVERLMRQLGLRGAVRGRAFKTTVTAEQLPRPADLGNRNLLVVRPNALWVSDLTYVATWRGFVYVAFVIDAFARRIVGWRVSTSLRSDLA